ncbi:hypothetical protein LAZ67_7003142 [Cordylochernes scorpioides]|uniref:Uncharacterized protein n=1 Tax=Cordylochernes scorpioides TaxID=51811 RepID=A0ABY6KNM1_9ARAC|nr:hypothetical protein LAZ67_7003142 [Cordylochernes scorpioides]
MGEVESEKKKENRPPRLGALFRKPGLAGGQPAVSFRSGTNVEFSTPHFANGPPPPPVAETNHHHPPMNPMVCLQEPLDAEFTLGDLDHKTDFSNPMYEAMEVGSAATLPSSAPAAVIAPSSVAHWSPPRLTDPTPVDTDRDTQRLVEEAASDC